MTLKVFKVLIVFRRVRHFLKRHPPLAIKLDKTTLGGTKPPLLPARAPSPSFPTQPNFMECGQYI